MPKQTRWQRKKKKKKRTRTTFAPKKLYAEIKKIAPANHPIHKFTFKDWFRNPGVQDAMHQVIKGVRQGWNNKWVQRALTLGSFIPDIGPVIGGLQLAGNLAINTNTWQDAAKTVGWAGASYLGGKVVKDAFGRLMKTPEGVFAGKAWDYAKMKGRNRFWRTINNLTDKSPGTTPAGSPALDKGFLMYKDPKGSFYDIGNYEYRPDPTLGSPYKSRGIKAEDDYFMGLSETYPTYDEIQHAKRNLFWNPDGTNLLDEPTMRSVGKTGIRGNYFNVPASKVTGQLRLPTPVKAKRILGKAAPDTGAGTFPSGFFS